MLIHVDRVLVGKYLRIHCLSLTDADEKRFMTNYLQYDGLLLLRILAQNTDDIVMSHLVHALYREYCKLLSNSDNNTIDEQQTN
jgi:hypothetical protein